MSFQHRFYYITPSLGAKIIMHCSIYNKYNATLLAGPIVEVEGPAFAESITEGDIRWIKSWLLLFFDHDLILRKWRLCQC
jgi:hypothetical protein